MQTVKLYRNAKSTFCRENFSSLNMVENQQKFEHLQSLLLIASNGEIKTDKNLEKFKLALNLIGTIIIDCRCMRTVSIYFIVMEME